MHLLLCYLKQISNATWNNYNTESKDSNTVCRNVRYFTARNVFITCSNVLKNISTFQRLKKLSHLFASMPEQHFTIKVHQINWLLKHTHDGLTFNSHFQHEFDSVNCPTDSGGWLVQNLYAAESPSWYQPGKSLTARNAIFTHWATPEQRNTVLQLPQYSNTSLLL